MLFSRTLAGAAALALCLPALAQTVTGVSFVNGITVSGGSLDLSAGSDFDRRVGFFSDIYYDRNRNEWWGLSDRGPGGGTLPYETRLQRFTLDVNPDTGAISNFAVAQTIKFNNAGSAFNGLGPQVPSFLGYSFDPEGMVVNPVTGNLLVSDEYGPSLYEFNRSGQLVKAFTVPSNLLPRAGASTDYNALPVAGLTSGREPNRGAEGLAISPDGKYAYSMLQNGTIQDGWSAAGGGTRGQYTRIVKYDVATGQAVAQYAYKLQSSGQGRGISAIVALGSDRFLVLERNNRGVGVGANVASPDKNVYEIDLSTATDVTGISLPASGALPPGQVAAVKVAKVMDLDADTLAALGNKSPEKWEGLAVGPQLTNGKYLVLAGTDNDYSVTQSGSGEQFDVWFNFGDADPYASSIQCPIGQTTGCFLTSNNATAATWNSNLSLLPGILHAYTANISGYIAPIPAPGSLVLAASALALLGWRRRRS